MEHITAVSRMFSERTTMEEIQGMIWAGTQPVAALLVGIADAIERGEIELGVKSTPSRYTVEEALHLFSPDTPRTYGRVLLAAVERFQDVLCPTAPRYEPNWFAAAPMSARERADTFRRLARYRPEYDLDVDVGETLRQLRQMYELGLVEFVRMDETDITGGLWSLPAGIRFVAPEADGVADESKVAQECERLLRLTVGVDDLEEFNDREEVDVGVVTRALEETLDLEAAERERRRRSPV